MSDAKTGESPPPPKRGMIFLHSKWLDLAALDRGERKPAQARVTRIAQGTVYYALQSETGEFGRSNERVELDRWSSVCKGIVRT